MRRVKNTDVRICRGDGYRVFIKSSGAATAEKDFTEFSEKLPSFTYSETIGFTQINFDI